MPSILTVAVDKHSFGLISLQSGRRAIISAISHLNRTSPRPRPKCLAVPLNVLGVNGVFLIWAGDIYVPVITRGRADGPGGGGHGLFEFGYQLRNYSPPFFDKGQPLVLPSPNLQPPLFIDTQEQPLEISIKWKFSVLHMSYCTKLFY